MKGVEMTRSTQQEPRVGFVDVDAAIAAIDSLRPWEDPTSMSPADWRRYLHVAGRVQATSAPITEGALDRYVRDSTQVPGSAGLNESKVFLMLRVVFDLPARAPVSERRSFKGWLNWPEADSEGMVNLGGPTVWSEAGPVLATELVGAAGRPYAATAEFRYLRSRYPFRNLSAVTIGDLVRRFGPNA